MKTHYLLPMLIPLLSDPSWGNVTLPAIISDRMVLTKTAKVPIWEKRILAKA